MKKMNKVLATALAVLTTVSAITASVYAGETISSSSLSSDWQDNNNTVTINSDGISNILVGIVPTVGDDGTVMLPVKRFAYIIDYTLLLEEIGKSLTMTNGNRTIGVSVDSTTAQLNGENIELEYNVIYADGEIYAALEDISTLFSYDVEYDETTGDVHLYVTDETPEAIVETETPSPELLEAQKIYSSVVVKADKTRENLTITFNGKEIDFSDAQPFIDDDGRTQTPVRALAEMLDCTVEWTEVVQMVTATSSDGTVVTMYIGDNKMYVDGSVINMDTSPMMIDDRTYVPIRYLSEAFGFNVTWEYED